MGFGVVSAIADTKLVELIKITDNVSYKVKEAERDQIVVAN